MKAIFESKRNLLAAAVATGVLYFTNQYIIMKILEPLGSDGMLRFQFAFDVETVAALFSAWGPGGIEALKTHFYLDFIHPLLYGSFLFLTMMYLRAGLSVQPAPGIPAYCYIPWAGALFDLVENALELAIIGQNPDLSAGLVFAAALVSLLKWSFAAVSIAIITVMGFRLALKMISSEERAS